MGTFDDPIGSVLIATWICAMLEMLILKDTYYYFTNYRDDSIFLKLFVGFTVLVDVACLIAAFGQVYLAGVTYWGNPIVLVQQYWPIPVSLVTTAIVAFLVQSFLIHRLWVLTRNWFIPIALATAATVSMICCAWVGILYAMHRDYADRYKGKTPVIVWMTTTTATDVLITLCLIIRLQKMKTNFKSTETVIARLTRGSMQTGATTAVLALAGLIAFLANNASNVEAATTFILARCYVLTLLYNVNLRGTHGATGNSTEKPESNHRMGPLSHTSPVEAFGGIEIHRTAHVHMDEESVTDADQKKGMYATESA
ncbi:hypothetical protein PQX77_013503 [Marasmius sp. AFHP31]|nr:hypothetical protein PQX77_013503 [Marasmius sp. AFHP31]